MFLIKLKLIARGAALAVAAGSSLLLAQQPKPAAPATSSAVADKTPRPAKKDLTPTTLPKLQAVIRPQDNEWRHLRVHWLTDIVAARKKAAAEDKPIIVLRTGGAGYNDPLGAC
jgi:hypothetical protein